MRPVYVIHPSIHASPAARIVPFVFTILPRTSTVTWVLRVALSIASQCPVSLGASHETKKPPSSENPFRGMCVSFVTGETTERNGTLLCDSRTKITRIYARRIFGVYSPALACPLGHNKISCQQHSPPPPPSRPSVVGISSPGKTRTHKSTAFTAE